MSRIQLLINLNLIQYRGVVYHNYAAHVAASPEMAAQLKAVNADIVVQTDRGVTPLVDSVRSRFGLRTSSVSRKPLA